MARTTSRKDALASFVWTVGAADMVVGGVGERGSLFAFGMLTVGAGLLVRWLRQQRYDSTTSQFSGGLRRSGKAFSGMTRSAAVLMAQQFRSARSGGISRSRQGYSPVARPGFRANNFVNPGMSRPSPGQNAHRRRSSPSAQTGVKPKFVVPNPASLNNLGPRAMTGPAPEDRARPAHRSIQGPPLDLPPAPRARVRRERRIY